MDASSFSSGLSLSSDLFFFYWKEIDRSTNNGRLTVVESSRYRA